MTESVWTTPSDTVAAPKHKLLPQTHLSKSFSDMPRCCVQISSSTNVLPVHSACGCVRIQWAACGGGREEATGTASHPRGIGSQAYLATRTPRYSQLEAAIAEICTAPAKVPSGTHIRHNVNRSAGFGPKATGQHLNRGGGDSGAGPEAVECHLALVFLGHAESAHRHVVPENPSNG